MSPAEMLSIAMGAAALLLSIPGTLLALRQLRTPAPAATPAPRPLVFARLALFAYAATMLVLIAAVLGGPDEAGEAVVFFGALALIAVVLAFSLKAGRGLASRLAQLFSGLSALYFLFLAASSIEGGEVGPLLWAVPVVAGLCVAVIALLAAAGRRPLT
ncbi:hypothetical protein Rhe02_65770 [Rhizocola hellebori]|uniref:Uncharacterized protein n=1 Tax=Rhizocola hellebori TaxID=1392758 RepID=A0A8J3QF91_9ACTN|nr:hypothetical protein [Rhizocola hellebori]GIH08510.1 hypothetical protein Rhe02_65770 [Rhizocola hellebori]